MLRRLTIPAAARRPATTPTPRVPTIGERVAALRAAFDLNEYQAGALALGGMTTAKVRAALDQSGETIDELIDRTEWSLRPSLRERFALCGLSGFLATRRANRRKAESDARRAAVLNAVKGGA